MANFELKTLKKIRHLEIMISEEQRAMRRTAELLTSIIPTTNNATWNSGDDANDHPECQFLAAVKAGDGAIISSYLVDPSFNVNMADSDGRCPLQTAVEDHPDLVQLLLPRANLAQIRRALFSAIRKDSLSLTAELLKSPVLYESNNVKLLSHVCIYAARQLDCFKIEMHTCNVHCNSSSKTGSGVNASHIPERFDSPIVLGAIRGSLDIVRLLINKGFTIPRPHSYLCTCSNCCTAKLDDFIHFSRMRLLVYTAFCSEVFLLLTTSDPVVSSFELSQELSSLAVSEQERSNEFNQLAEDAGKLAVSLLEQCRDSTETFTILSRGAVRPRFEKLSLEVFEVVSLAIKYRQKQFIAHHLTQWFLELNWYHGMPSYRLNGNWLRTFVLCITIFLLSPVRAFLYILLPYWPFSEWLQPIKFIYHSPSIKFMDHVTSHLAFLVLMCVRFSVFTPGFFGWMFLSCRPQLSLLEFYGPITLNFLLAFWILGFVAMQIRTAMSMSCPFGAISRSRWHFRHDAWTGISWLMSACYILVGVAYGILAITFWLDETFQDLYCSLDHKNNTLDKVTFVRDSPLFCTIVDHMSHSNHTWFKAIYWDPTEMTNGVLGAASLLSFALLLSYLPISPHIGPIVVTFQRMMGDLIAALVACAVLTLAFVVAITCIYANYMCMDSQFSRPLLVAKSLFGALLGFGDINAPTVNRPDKSNLTDDQITLIESNSSGVETVGYILWSAYLISVVLVLMTLLKLLTLETFSRTFAFQRDIEWKFTRTELRLKFYGDFNALAAPFNLLEYFHLGIRWLAGRKWRTRQITRALVQMSMSSSDSNTWWSSEVGKWQQWQSWVPNGLAGKNYIQTCQLLVDRYLHRNEKVACDAKPNLLESIELKLGVYRRELRRVIAFIAAELAKSTAVINADCDSIASENSDNPRRLE